MGAEPGGESAEAVVEQWSIETVGHAVWGDEMNQTKAEQPFEYRTFGGDFEVNLFHFFGSRFSIPQIIQFAEGKKTSAKGVHDCMGLSRHDSRRKLEQQANNQSTHC